LTESKVVDQYRKVIMVAVLNHGHRSMGYIALGIVHELGDNTHFSSSVTLDDPDSLTNLEGLSDLECFCFDLDRFALLSYEMNVAICDVFDDS
jgi:hypothetical protein